MSLYAGNSEKNATVLMYGTFVTFYDTETYDMCMKAHLYGEFVCIWCLCEHMFDMRSSALWTRCK